MVALALFTGIAQAQTTGYHDNVVIVLDASGSMQGELRGAVVKMDAAKSALKEVLSTVPASTHVGLLVFSARNLKDDWVYPLGPRDDDRLMRAIDLPMPNRGTPLGAYIKKGADRLLEERKRQYGYGSYRLLVVTDGEAGDRDLVERYTPEVISRGITMDVIGVGMKSRHTLATMAHSYRAADDPASLKRAIAEVFAEVSSTGDDGGIEEAFELLEPIPVEMASAIVQALATSGNHPIGTEARETVAATASSVPVAAQNAAGPPRKQPSAMGTWFSVVLVGALVFVGIVVLAILILVKVAKGSRR